MNDCIFCAIANGDIPSRKVYEDEHVLAFLDVNPTSYGHTLVIPKKHADSFLDVSEEDLASLMETAQKIAVQLEEKLGCDGINVLSNVHEAAGQSVKHFHVHLIPRYLDPEKEAIQIAFSSLDGLDLDEVLETITK